MANSNSSRLIISIVVLVLLIAAGYWFVTPRERTLGEKVGDAASELSDGVKDAVDATQDKSPAEKVGDAVKDATNGQ